MDSLKLPGLNKMTKNAANSRNQKKVDIKLNEDEMKTVMELKKLHLETIKLDVELQKEIYNLEKSFESKHTEIFEKRQNILNEIRKTPGDGMHQQPNLCHFWLKVLKSSYTEFISKRDEQILVHLIDIRNRLHTEPIVKFVLEFHFEPNEFFSNPILVKSYFLNCLPDADDPFSYDGAEIYKCEGCCIDWKREMSKEKDKRTLTSFFDFFNPPELPENSEDPNYYDINAILQNDFELGFYLKERVIPKAVMFFTGEIADCQTSDSESEETDDEDELEDDDDDEENEEATNDAVDGDDTSGN